MSDDLIEINRQSHSLAEKHTYFLFGAVGACLAFALTQTKSTPLSWNHIVLGLAILSWALSFFFGCQRIESIMASKIANVILIQIDTGKHRLCKTSPDNLRRESQKVYDKYFDDVHNANRKLKFQLFSLIIGVVFYFSWHVYQMYLLR